MTLPFICLSTGPWLTFLAKRLKCSHCPIFFLPNSKNTSDITIKFTLQVQLSANYSSCFMHVINASSEQQTVCKIKENYSYGSTSESLKVAFSNLTDGFDMWRHRDEEVILKPRDSHIRSAKRGTKGQLFHFVNDDTVFIPLLAATELALINIQPVLVGLPSSI